MMDNGRTRTVGVELDEALIEMAEDAGLDVSAVTRHALKRALGTRLETDPRYAADAREIRREIADEVAWYNRRIEEHGLFADGWRSF
jgi:post-segregation antitoxin (ccd killing protein)